MSIDLQTSDSIQPRSSLTMVLKLKSHVGGILNVAARGPEEPQRSRYMVQDAGGYYTAAIYFVCLFLLGSVRGFLSRVPSCYHL